MHPSQGALVRCKGIEPLHPCCYEGLETVASAYWIAFVYVIILIHAVVRIIVMDRICSKNNREIYLYLLHCWLNIFFLYHDLVKLNIEH